MESSTIEGFKPKDNEWDVMIYLYLRKEIFHLVIESNYLARNKYNSPIIFSAFACLVVCIVQRFFITQTLY
jgi:hypothetical protein